MVEELPIQQIGQATLCFTVGLIVAIVFWFWMIVDCIRHETVDRKKWLRIILLYNLPGAIYYFFIEKKYHMWQPPKQNTELEMMAGKDNQAGFQ